VLSVLVESLADRLGGVADAMLRPELLRGATQARRESAHGSPAHLTIKILSIDTRLRLAEDDHALHRHGLLITRACCVRAPCVREYAIRRPQNWTYVHVSSRVQIQIPRIVKSRVHYGMHESRVHVYICVFFKPSASANFFACFATV